MGFSFRSTDYVCLSLAGVHSRYNSDVVCLGFIGFSLWSSTDFCLGVPQGSVQGPLTLRTFKSVFGV